MTGFVVCILVAIDVEFGLKFEGTLRDANMHEFGLPHFLRSGVKTTGFALASPPGPGGVLAYVGHIGMCRCEGYGFQAVYSSIGYINQSVWV